MPYLNIIEVLAETGCLGLLLWIGRRDFQTLKVSNQSNLLLLALYIIWLASRQFVEVQTDLLVALLFFCVALVMWLAKAMGAGDVKLYFVLGLFIGIEGSAAYVVILLLVSLVAFLFLKFWKIPAPTSDGETWTSRMREFQKSGRLPYAVIMVIAAFVPLSLRFFGQT